MALVLVMALALALVLVMALALVLVMAMVMAMDMVTALAMDMVTAMAMVMIMVTMTVTVTAKQRRQKVKDLELLIESEEWLLHEWLEKLEGYQLSSDDWYNLYKILKIIGSYNGEDFKIAESMLSKIFNKAETQKSFHVLVTKVSVEQYAANILF
jgi:hypothetical protein